MKFKKKVALIILLATFSFCLNSQILETVPSVDLKRYAGKWYEIASFPQRFQKGCHCTTAEYILTDAHYLRVTNRCNKGSVNGKESSITGKAFVKKNSGNAKLYVQFFWPFKGKYWIIDLAEDYRYAVVSHPNRKYLWILSRNPWMREQDFKEILNKLELNNFDIGKLEKTVQITDQ